MWPLSTSISTLLPRKNSSAVINICMNAAQLLTTMSLSTSISTLLPQQCRYQHLYQQWSLWTTVPLSTSVSTVIPLTNSAVINIYVNTNPSEQQCRCQHLREHWSPWTTMPLSTSMWTLIPLNNSAVINIYNTALSERRCRYQTLHENCSLLDWRGRAVKLFE